jgi:hypothetical protein
LSGLQVQHLRREADELPELLHQAANLEQMVRQKRELLTQVRCARRNRAGVGWGGVGWVPLALVQGQQWARLHGPCVAASKRRTRVAYACTSGGLDADCMWIACGRGVEAWIGRSCRTGGWRHRSRR